MSVALAFTGASIGLEALNGLFGYFTSKAAAGIAESRSRLLRMEAEADAQRFQEQVQTFKAMQSVAFLKKGVTLEGSPLDILDETARVASENLSAARSRSESQILDAKSDASAAITRGRTALLAGITSGLAGFSRATFTSERRAV